MRTTVRLDEHLMAQVKRYAEKRGKTLTAIIEESLRETLRRRPSKAAETPIRLPTVKGHGLRPGLDVDDMASLLDHMDKAPR